MKDALERKLLTDYPTLFSSTRFYFGVGDGWYPLINALCACIENDIKYNRMPEVEVMQVKEKFGGLRFYVNGGDDRTLAYISMAEAVSFTMCEVCGDTRDIHYTSGWIKTLCKKHYDEHGGNNNGLG